VNKRCATTYSQTLDLPRLATRPSWSILSSHRHACNLLADDGTLVALVSEVHGNGPFHLVVPQARFETIAPATTVKWRAGQIELPHLTIDLHTARPWHPQLPHLTNPVTKAPLSPYKTVAIMRSPLYRGSAVVTNRAQQGIHGLRQGIAQGDDELLRQGVTALAGLGPGLTPAGDDFLIGLLVALTLGSSGERKLEEYRATIATAAAQATTQLSATWLRHAAQGHFGEQWHKLVHALNRGLGPQIGQRVTTILKTGATSGADAFCGFLVGLEAVSIEK
jgi:uncharacterized protein YukE